MNTPPSLRPNPDLGALSLHPTTLFSPSKAAAQRAQAADWVSIDSWLASRYQGRSVPIFERNDDTLRALQTLMQTNERADEERELLGVVMREGVAELKARKERPEKGVSGEFIAAVVKRLDEKGNVALKNIASTHVALDIPSRISTDRTTSSNTSMTDDLTSSLLTATQTSHTLTNHLTHLSTLQSHLDQQMTQLRAQLSELRSPAYQVNPQLGRQTLEWSRNTKQLRSKLGEYTDRLGAIQRENRSLNLDSMGGNVVEMVSKQEQRISGIEREVAGLESQVSAFKGLPGDRDGARRQVERIDKEVLALRRRRDALFAGMSDKDTG